MKEGIITVMTFKLKKLFLDVEERQLIINDRVIPLSGLCEFSLTLESGAWMLTGKRDLLFEVSEPHYGNQNAGYGGDLDG